MVELIAISEHGCSDTVSHIVYINEELIFYIPNSFTPNDDGINQLFLPVFTSGFDPYDFNLKIYNRWGEQIFESTLATYGWDGKYKGETVPDGAYNWKIEFKRSTSDEHKMISGHVTVLH
jgi:gliding motility-associated-like protein